MISEKTVSSWLADFNKDGTEPLEKFLKLQAGFLSEEPLAYAMIMQLIAQVRFENPVLPITIALSVYHECLRRQKESDKLKSDIEGFQ